jgi:hypothetical protein
MRLAREIEERLQLHRNYAAFHRRWGWLPARARRSLWTWTR